MKLKRVWVRNYKEFRETFITDSEANFVLKNLQEEVSGMVQSIIGPHIDLTIMAAYDEDGEAIFDVALLKVLRGGGVIVEVDYTGTAK